MTAAQILSNIGFAFWLVLGEAFFAILGLLIVYAVILAIYTLIIKR
jgi:hypothetical protein